MIGSESERDKNPCPDNVKEYAEKQDISPKYEVNETKGGGMNVVWFKIVWAFPATEMTDTVKAEVALFSSMFAVQT